MLAAHAHLTAFLAVVFGQSDDGSDLVISFGTLLLILVVLAIIVLAVLAVRYLLGRR